MTITLLQPHPRPRSAECPAQLAADAHAGRATGFPTDLTALRGRFGLLVPMAVLCLGPRRGPQALLTRASKGPPLMQTSPRGRPPRDDIRNGSRGSPPFRASVPSPGQEGDEVENHLLFHTR